MRVSPGARIVVASVYSRMILAGETLQDQKISLAVFGRVQRTGLEQGEAARDAHAGGRGQRAEHVARNAEAVAQGSRQEKRFNPSHGACAAGRLGQRLDGRSASVGLAGERCRPGWLRAAPACRQTAPGCQNSGAKDFTEGAVDLLINSLFQSWLATSPKGLQK